jgi:RNA polymerase sigma-70 factor, ECF subfamily
MTPSDREPSSDKDLVQAAQRGDIRAFETLIHRYDKRVLSIALRFSHNSDDAKDIYQDVFMRVHRGLGKFEFQSEFSTWLYRVTTNVCLSHSASAKKKSESQRENSMAENFSEPKTHGPELRLYLQEALTTLSPNQKIAFVLKHDEGYDIKEIAAMMDCAEGTVKRHLFNAIERLRRVLKDVSI